MPLPQREAPEAPPCCPLPHLTSGPVRQASMFRPPSPTPCCCGPDKPVRCGKLRVPVCPWDPTIQVPRVPLAARPPKRGHVFASVHADGARVAAGARQEPGGGCGGAGGCPGGVACGSPGPGNARSDSDPDGAQTTLVIDLGETEKAGNWGVGRGGPWEVALQGRPGAGLRRTLRNGFPCVNSPGPPSDLKRQASGSVGPSEHAGN